MRSGETVAIVGPSGSGKSTLAQICCGLVPVDAGDVRIYGKSLRDQLYFGREQIAYVPQNPYLFAGRVYDNIAYGRSDATRAQVEEAAKSAFAHAFIEGLADGYDTEILEHGTGLSGGQRQRIAIVRVFLKQAPILILDEATSALDNESEQVVHQALETLLEKATAIVIAHRLSTVQNADRVIVVDDGQIVEEGTHDELLKLVGMYARLYDASFQSQGMVGNNSV